MQNKIQHKTITQKELRNFFNIKCFYAGRKLYEEYLLLVNKKPKMKLTSLDLQKFEINL